MRDIKVSQRVSEGNGGEGMTSDQLLEVSVSQLEWMNDNELLAFLGPLLRHTRPTDETRRKSKVTKEIDLESGEVSNKELVEKIPKAAKPKKMSVADKLQETMIAALKMIEESKKV